MVAFDGTGSTAQGGAGIEEYLWDLGDGMLDSTSGATLSHTFPDAGPYTVTLTVTDDAGCVSTRDTLQVFVSTTPSFAGTTSGQAICLGDTVQLNAVVAAVPWTTGAGSAFGAGALIPDDQTTPFVTTLEVSSFDPGATVATLAQAPEICVNMEHSYMGDLVIQVTCPNGQSIITHQQGGAGTFIGIPVDDESGTPGTCLEYCWNADALNGTWMDNSGGSLPSGIYQSVEPFTNLVGCPLNGTWTLTITDNFGADDGYLCAWSLSLDSVLFTPVLGLDADSAGWQGAGIISSAGLQATVLPASTGTSNYTFSVTDNFGCTYDTTVTVSVLDLQIQDILGPTVLPGPGDVTFTIDPPMPAAQYIIWDPLPAGWLWSGNDPIHIDGQAILTAPPQAGMVQICAQAVLGGCEGDVFCIDVSSFLGVEEATNAAGFHLGPNPSEGVVRITRSGAQERTPVDVFDEAGRVVHRATFIGQQLIMDLAHLPVGNYQARWVEGASVRVASFVLAR